MRVIRSLALGVCATLAVLGGCTQGSVQSSGNGAVMSVPRAPVLLTDLDTDGRPLPFGRRPYQPPETPLGSGPYKAIMATAANLPAHVLYHPADLANAPKLPIVAWGNGACINAGNRFRDLLTEIASHGYLVAANGVMANPNLEVGAQENPAVRPPGSPPPPPPATPAPNANAQRAPGTTTAAQLVETIDWAIRENERPGSPFYQRIDTSKVAVLGQSCGGVQALTVAGDPRIDTMMIFASGAGMIPNAQPDAQTMLAAVHTPIAYIYGTAELDVAYYSATDNVNALAARGVPVFGAWQDNMTHLGTYGQVNGGFFGNIAVAWLNWQLKGDRAAARMFRGADCILCRAPDWHVTKGSID
jgi:dienelactone hydrolase